MDEHRKLMKRIEHSNHARFLTFSCYQQMPLFKNDAIKDAFVEQIDKARQKTSFHLLAWVIMPEHVHLLIWPKVSEFPASKVSWWLKRDFACRVITRWRELDASILENIQTPGGKHRFWQHGGGYDRNIVDGHELMEKIRYIHANPVRRSLVARPEEWKWSSARWYAGMREGGLTIDKAERPEI